MSLCMETRGVLGGDVGVAAVRELVVNGCAADDGADKELGADVVKGLGADAVKGLGADAVRGLGADAVKGLGAGVVKELGAGAVKGLGADDVGVDDVMVSDESVVGVIVNIAAGTETVGTATPAVFLSTRSGFFLSARSGFLAPAAGLTSDW